MSFSGQYSRQKAFSAADSNAEAAVSVQNADKD